MKLFNTLTNKKEEFEPLNSDRVGMYVCGPTVYDRIHIGNARSLIVYDILFRILGFLYGQSQVTYIRNITDVDDKIIAKSIENDEQINAYTDRMVAEFYQDDAILGNLVPTLQPKASAHLPQMFELINKLLEQGHAYHSQKHILFDVTTIKDFGKLSGRKIGNLISGIRVPVESYKKNPGDFVLWKPAAGNEQDPGFLSPWGVGRPGWHIECSAMSTRYLGETFDIHGGGADLMFPHHENEIAQSTCAHPGSEYAKFWVHNGFVTVEGQKMSKSSGNFITVRDLADKKHLGEAIRLSLMLTHYRKPLSWSTKNLQDAQMMLDKLYEKLAGVDSKDNKEASWDIIDVLEDDLNVPLALTFLCNVPANQLRATGKLLGILQQDPIKWLVSRRNNVLLTNEEIDSVLTARNELRRQKKWDLADKLRDHLLSHNVVIEDSETGSRWRVL